MKQRPDPTAHEEPEAGSEEDVGAPCQQGKADGRGEKETEHPGDQCQYRVENAAQIARCPSFASEDQAARRRKEREGQHQG